MLFVNTPTTIGIWLFVPAYVAIVRHGMLRLLRHMRRYEEEISHLESSYNGLVTVYSLPAALSLAANIFFHLQSNKGR